MRNPLIQVLVWLLLSASICQATGVTEKVIMPVSGQGVPGENGSLWKAILVGYNANAVQVPVHISSPYSCLDCYPPLDPLRPNETYTFQPSAPEPAMGVFVYVGDVTDPATVGRVVLKARVQDMSRQSLTWGTEIPVVREKDLRTGPIVLVGVPTDSRFRQAVRIYDYDNSRSDVRMKIVEEKTGVVVVDKTVNLSAGYYPEGSVPAQVAINNLIGAFPELPRNTTVRVEIEPLTPGMRFWAFASITNNDTQHVTVITP